MPVRKLAHSHVKPPKTQKLLADLLAEWKTPSNTPAQPVIIEDGGGIRPVHLYVIWDAWRELDQLDRSEIIMDAYEQLRGQSQSANVTVAMGLTETEAQRLGISYQ